MNDIEMILVLALGPPTEGEEYTQFYNYQSNRRYTYHTEDSDWEVMEMEAVTKLLKSHDGVPSGRPQ